MTGIFTLTAAVLTAIMAMVRYPGVATVPPPLNMATQTLATVHSYRATVTFTVHMPGGLKRGAPTSSLVETIDYVRHGSTFQTYVVVTETVAGHGSRQETVDTGTRTCTRQSSRARWLCVASGGPTPHAGSPDPRTVASLQQLRTTVLWKATGQSVVEGQQCMGYEATGTAGKATAAHGTLWISLATKRPVKLADMGGQSRVLVSAETVTWGHWNDPNVSIPTLPPVKGTRGATP